MKMCGDSANTEDQQIKGPEMETKLTDAGETEQARASAAWYSACLCTEGWGKVGGDI